MKNPHKNPSKGFALIVTLSLMILLTVIAVGLLSLSSVALRSSSQNQAIAEARANAKLSLMLAIGDLQKQLGHDNRISVTSDQVISQAGLSGDLLQKHYVGAYMSWGAGVEDRPGPEFLQWFSSSTPANLKNKDWILSPPEAANSIELAGVKSGVKGGDIVRVPLISSNPTAAGRHQFGWWVSDLGTKGLISRAKKPANGDATLVREDMQTMPGYGIGNVGPVGGPRPFGTVDTTGAPLDKVVSLASASLLPGFSAPVNGLIHDLTAYNRSLITNVRSGGFRKDLSFYLEKDAANKPTEALYTARTPSASEDGINMSELWLHYNIYKHLKKGGDFTYTSTLSSSTPKEKIPATASYFQMEGTKAKAEVDDAYAYKQPAIIHYQTLLSFRAIPATVNGVVGANLQIVADPIITYWNPLDVPVVVTPAYNSIMFWQLPYDIKINHTTKEGISTTHTASIKQCLGGDLDSHYLTLRTGKVQPLVLKPGEVLMASQGPNTPTINQYSKGTRINQNYFDGEAGWNFGGGVAYLYGGPTLFLKKDDTFTYEVKPNEDLCRGGAEHKDIYFQQSNLLYYKEDGDYSADSLFKGAIVVHSRLIAKNNPLFFDKINSTRVVKYPDVLNRKQPFMLHCYRAKTEQGSQRPSRFLSRFNPKVMSIGFLDLSPRELDMLPFEVQIKPLTSFKDAGFEVSIGGNGYFGGGMDAATGNSFICTHSVPREPLYSLGAFQHAFANGTPTALPLISQPIGNSFAPSIIPPDKTADALPAIEPSVGNPNRIPPRVLADHSYLANQALWDDWFFSSIAPQTAAGFTTKRIQKQVYQDFLDGKQKLPNHCYMPALGGLPTASAVTKLFPATTPAPDAHLTSASLLEVDGMFNVNSTSVDAWKSLLSALKKRDSITRATSSSAEAHTPNADATTVAGLNSPIETIVNAKNTVDIKDASQWTGRRTLSDDEIDSLATAIVKQVRARGPFLSLADFVNRRITTDEDLAISGCIQSALDSPESGINKGFQDPTRSVSSTAAYAFPKAEAGPAATGIPGIIKQADILTPIAPYISVRSDSFLIRACGRKLDPTGKILASAYCEAVIQRKADFVDPTNPATTAAASLSTLNKAFGRRFEIVSFRWLSQDEI